ncbi:MAG: hypothetical protein U1F33_03115 [Alphaproteobacteria bacterium]
MDAAAKRLSLAFAAGALGALAHGFALWFAGHIHLTAAIGVAIAPGLNTIWFYPHIVWGGLWGFLFALPVLERSWVVRGLVLSLAPTLVQLFVIFPERTTAGTMGLGLGHLTPLVVLVANGIWGLAAAGWYRLLR